MEKFESFEQPENLSEHQREILDNVGLGSIKELKELLENLDADSDEAKYFAQVLKDLEP